MGSGTGRIWVGLVGVLGVLFAGVVGSPPVEAGQDGTSPLVDQLDLVGPAGSEEFGDQVVVLANGNYVVTDPLWDDGGTADVGAVYLYDGLTNTVISTLTGSTLDDRVGVNGVTALTNGNYVVESPFWVNGGATNVGAVTWGNGTTGVTGAVSAANSLVGSTLNDLVGFNGVTALTNGNYVVRSHRWDNDFFADVGAVTWGDGTTGVTGAVSAGNSLVGSTPDDRVGSGGVTVLTNGNYVVRSHQWVNGGAANAGAVTWGDGTTGVTGEVDDANSLVGSTLNDFIGGGGVTALTNGNYVVASSNWNDGVFTDVGAVTWGDGTGGVTGEIDDLNSLVGSTPLDRVGSGGVRALTNGNYVAASSNWDNDFFADVGAVTWGNGTAGITGAVSAANSLVGSNLNDRVGGGGVTALTNGNYVVRSPEWDNGGMSNLGAVTWGNGTAGIAGPVTAANSLVGSTPFDFVGLNGVTALTNGNYVVVSRSWDNGGMFDVGAVTWGDGTAGVAGAVSAANSLVGSTPFDLVGSNGVTALTNGNYVVRSPEWDNGGMSNLGAVTWGNGTAGIAGPVTAANSLVGSTPFDFVGGGGVTALTNGNYVVRSQFWDGGAADVGAVTWGNGTAGIAGAVTAANSLVGTTLDDSVGINGVTALTNGNYVVASRNWDNGGMSNLGAVTWGEGTAGIAGPVTAANSLIGTTTSDLVGNGGVTVLEDGNYVVRSQIWDNGGVANAGAVTFGFGDVATGGVVSSANSVIGTPPGSVQSPSGLLTSGNAVPVPTSQNRVLLMLDPPPFFPTTPPDVNAQTVGNAAAVKVDYPLPVAEDSRSTPTVACAPASGSLFPIGTTTVLCTATDSAGSTATTGFDVTVTAPDFVSVTPARLLDTRPSQSTVDGLFNGDGQRQGGSTLTLKIAGRAGVPADAVAAAINVTATNTAARGFITVFPCDQTRPNASNLNVNPGVVVPNLVITALDGNGEVCIYTHTATDVVVDVAGYFPATTTFETINPARLLDTRPGETTIDGQSAGTGIADAGETTVVQITGRAGIPADATAAALNLTLTGTTGQMFATIWPCDTTRPEASNINATSGATIANSAISKLAADGSICIYTLKASQVIVDAAGWFTNTSDYTPLTPARLLDTRPGQTTIDGQSAGAGLRPAGTTTTLQIGNRGGAPNKVATVVVNVTATQTVKPGFITVYPCNETRPNASNLNYQVGTTVANNVIVKVSPTGTICLYNHTGTQLIADINGYLPN